MSTLLVQEVLAAPLVHTFVATRRMIINSIRPKLVLFNDPPGTWTFTIKQGTSSIASKSITMADIITGAGYSPGEYHYGFYKVEFNNDVILNPGTYTIELTTSGYSFTELSYLGWIKEHENLTNTFTDGFVAESDLDNPLSVQIWTFQE